MKTDNIETKDDSSVDDGLKVAVVRGGSSREREISLKTGRAVADALDNRPCEVLEYDTSSDLGTTLEQDGIDVVFLALHGRGGEDGTLQAVLEWRDISFTGPGSRASALCMDKLRTRQLFDRIGVPSPKWFRLREGDTVENKNDFDRMVVKPRFEGSSLGLSIVEESDLDRAVNEAWNFDEDVIVEEYVDGYELTVGAVTLDDLEILPPVGIRPGHEFFDYETKYTKGLTEYDVPADLSESERSRVESLTETIVSEAETEELCRVDYIMDSDGEFYLLEINTIPGLTETSLLPKAASEAGVNFEELIWSMVQYAGRETNVG